MLTGNHTPDAEIRASSLPIIAVQVIEKPIVLDITLQDELTHFVALTDRYTHIWYFTHETNISILRQALQRIDEERQHQESNYQPLLSRVTFYNSDSQALQV
ncbi:hypothetical protein [Dictyobacter arantiisoli]|uniref:Uncharacterized protein n=1 Tax=Dictyobacter arantiisoli TaxID=2014874 RepID=A0A5A5TLS6_9CHLR|nr:hypothetical protein [Dictyobacter arantiisoli]GCF12044.1 hypothetical protein KDI_56080 [Dictyobacter arantiisoli]